MARFKKAELLLRRALLKSLNALGRSQAPPVPVDCNNRKFLFIRQDRIGDVLVSTPLLHSLKRRYPLAIIDVLLSTSNATVLDNDPVVRKRWIYDKMLFSSFSLLFQIRKERYDVVVDLMDNPSATSTVILLLAGGTWNVGLAKDNQYAYDVTVPLLSRKDTHIVDRLARLLHVFGIESEHEDLRIHYTPTHDSIALAQSLLKSSSVQQGLRVGINISAGSDARFWGVDRFRGLIEALSQSEEAPQFILLFKESDTNRARDIAGHRSDVILPPKLTFDQFAAVIKHMQILITPDTSAVHLAAAFQVPAVVLYVQADPSLRIWEPYRSDYEAVVTTGETLATLALEEVLHAYRTLASRITKKQTGLTYSAKTPR